MLCFLSLGKYEKKSVSWLTSPNPTNPTTVVATVITTVAVKFGQLAAVALTLYWYTAVYQYYQGMHVGALSCELVFHRITRVARQTPPVGRISEPRLSNPGSTTGKIAHPLCGQNFRIEILENPEGGGQAQRKRWLWKNLGEKKIPLTHTTITGYHS